jgi:hypothetical protein
MSDGLSTALVELKRDEVVEMVRGRIDEGEDPVPGPRGVPLRHDHRWRAVPGRRVLIAGAMAVVVLLKRRRVT